MSMDGWTDGRKVIYRASATEYWGFARLPSAYPLHSLRAGKQKRPPRGRFKHLISLNLLGAGEANRTPDPNLGKVMLYP